jgi:hypothetical protein
MADKEFAVFGVNRHIDHFATAAEQSQHIDKLTVPLVVPAKFGADDFGMLAVCAQRFDGLSEGNGVIGYDCGALFGLVEARHAIKCIGGHGRKAYSDSQKDRSDKSESRHGRGVNGVPVNAT